MKFTSYEEIMNIVTKKNRIPRLILLIIGSFLAALVYNVFVVPNNLVYGGVGGLAIVVNKLTGINTTIFIDVVTIILIIITLIILGPKKTSYTIIGYGAYAIMISLTSPIKEYFNFTFDSFLLSVLIYSFIAGIGYGIIYKCGFNTGGADSIVAIAQHFFKAPTGKLSTIINGVIIIIGAFTFGLTKTIYAIIYLKVNNFISDVVILGMKTSKIVFIKSRYNHEVEDYLNKEVGVGYTLIDTGNGVGLLKKQIIMCVVSSEHFYNMKNELVKIDKKIEIISNDCYTVEGGTTNELIKV